MVAIASIPSFQLQQQHSPAYARPEVRTMSRDARGRPSVRRPRPGPATTPSPGLSEGRQSPFVPAGSEDPNIQRSGSITMPTGAEPVWATAPYYRESYPSPSIQAWPQQYTVGTSAGEDIAAVSGYASGPSTDPESTSGFDELMFQSQMNQFSGTFDENQPLESMHGGSPYLFGATPLHTIPVHAQVPPSMIVPSTPMTLPAPETSPRSSTPVIVAPTAIAPGVEAPKGKKRVRSPSPEEKPFHGSLAHTMRKRQATESSTSMGPIRVRTPQSTGTSSDTSARPSADPGSSSKGFEGTTISQRRRPGQARQKEDSRAPGACWRCRRYKKPCNNREGTCDTCLTSGFRIWPASLGCRRGGIHEFVDILMPDGMEDTISALPSKLSSRNTWRSNLEAPVGTMPAEREGRQQDKWDHLCEKVVSTRLFGLEFVELFEILANHQRQATRESGKEHPLLNLVAAALSYSVDLYHRFVVVNGHRQPERKPQTTHKNIMDLRESLSNTLSAWLSLCLRGRLTDFPVAFLVALLALCSLIIFSDAVYVLKAQTGELVWTGTAREHMMRLRSELLTISVDLLGVVAKGSKPLRFQCFTRETDEPRSAEGMRLMADNAANFDIMSELQRWILRHRACFIDDSWAETLPYTPGPVPRPIQSMSRFVQMGYGNVQDI